jgi:hypothetical protein
MMETFLTQIALALHSFFESMLIGIEKDNSIVLVLVSAIALHRWAEALSVGFSLNASGIPKHVALKYAMVHTFLTVFAIGMGHQLSQASGLVKGVANAVSGGTFIYISMFEKIKE